MARRPEQTPVIGGDVPGRPAEQREAGSAAAKELVGRILAASGGTLNGPAPWDVVVHDERTFARVLKDGSLGAGESYMDGWWDCERLDELASRVLDQDLGAIVKRNVRVVLGALKERFVNLQSPKGSRKVADVHYDLGNSFFEAMLGPTMAYSCGYWRQATDLDRAQRDKMELICRKLDIGPGDRLLDIGCGWGSFARYAAEKYRCEVVGITISESQADYATELCRGLPVEILLMDYRSEALAARGPFDKLVSVGMLEHVGKKNLRRFVGIANGLLTSRGTMLLQSIGKTGRLPDLWVSKYIFPNSYLPTVNDVAKAIESFFVIEDWHNFGADYDKTLMAWHANFESWAQLPTGRMDDRFRRMWRYYLLTSAGCFRSRTLQLWQLVLSKGGIPGGYLSLR